MSAIQGPPPFAVFFDHQVEAIHDQVDPRDIEALPQRDGSLLVRRISTGEVLSTHLRGTWHVAGAVPCGGSVDWPDCPRCSLAEPAP